MVDWLNHQLKLYVKQKWTYVSNRLSSITLHFFQKKNYNVT